MCLNGPMLCLLSESLEHSVSTSRPSSLLRIVVVGHELSSSNPEEVLSMWETHLTLLSRRSHYFTDGCGNPGVCQQLGSLWYVGPDAQPQH